MGPATHLRPDNKLPVFHIIVPQLSLLRPLCYGLLRKGLQV